MTGLNVPDALVFDLDGTLWDAAVPTARGWNQALVELGAETRVSVDGIRSVAGTPFVGCVEILVPELSPPSDAVLRALDDREKEALVESGGTLFPGVQAGLRELAESYPLYLVSNCQDWYLELFLDKTGLGGYFTGQDCNGSSGLTKPEMLGRLSETLRPRRATYVGDTQGDHDAAVTGGMSFAFARYGFGSVSQTDLAFDDFPSLVDHFLGR